MISTLYTYSKIHVFIQTLYTYSKIHVFIQTLYTNPMYTCFMFPGHGSAYVSMAAKLVQKYPSVQAKFDFITNLYLDIAYYAQNNQENSDIPSVFSSQLALYTMSCSLYDLMLSEKNTYANYTLGHSLGGYASLYASGLITFEQGIDIIITQNKYISDLKLKKTGMLACFAADNTKISHDKHFDSFVNILQQVCYETGIYFQQEYMCSIANYNSHTQIILSGNNEALAYASNTLSEQYNIKSLFLKSEYAYHSALLKPAGIALEKYLTEYVFTKKSQKNNKTDQIYPSAVITEAQCLAIANTTALDTSVCAHLIASQLYKPVYWIQTIDTLIEAGITHFYELGPKNVLEKLLSSHPKASEIEIFSIDDI